MRLRFLSGNEHKIAEASKIMELVNVTVVPIQLKVEEIQTSDIAKIVNDKAAKAFHRTGYPLFVEQTGLFIDRLKGFPGGLTQIFWDTLQADSVSELFGSSGVTARTVIGYCDGRVVRQFEGEIRGKIAEQPRGNRAFQWDCIFIPDGNSETFAEMGDKKNEISMRRIALDKLAKYLGAGHA